MTVDSHPDEFGDSWRRNIPHHASMTDGSADSDVLMAAVDGCRSGDRRAQRQVYEVFHRQIYRLMARMVGVDEAADVTQQVFLHSTLR